MKILDFFRANFPDHKLEFSVRVAMSYFGEYLGCTRRLWASTKGLKWCIHIQHDTGTQLTLAVGDPLSGDTGKEEGYADYEVETREQG